MVDKNHLIDIMNILEKDFIKSNDQILKILPFQSVGLQTIKQVNKKTIKQLVNIVVFSS